MIRSRDVVLLFVLFNLVATDDPTCAQVLPLGRELQVNVFTIGPQLWPAVTVAPDGTFTVTWYCGDDLPGGSAVLGRRFDAEGLPLGGELLMSQMDASWSSDVGADAAGNFVLAWGQGGPGSGGPPDYVKGRRFAADAVPLGDQFEISEPPGTDATGQVRLAARADGSFVVVWQDYGVFARRFASDGAPLGVPFQVAGLSNRFAGPIVAPEPDGGFLVVWNEETGVPEDYVARGRRFDADGDPVGPILELVGDETFIWAWDVEVEADGSFVLVWVATGSLFDRILARRFDADGLPLGPEVVVQTYTSLSTYSSVSIATAPDDSRVVVWDSWGSPGSDQSFLSVQARRFDAAWTPLGAQFQVNLTTELSQWGPAVAMQPNGDFVVAWSSGASGGTDRSEESVQARRFRSPFFIDGFESGDTSRWSAAIPARRSDRAR